jgi:MFS family permease
MQTTVVTAYLIAGVVCIVSFLLALLLSNKVNYEPGRSDVGQRQRYFWFLMVFSLLIGLLLNYFLELRGIRIPSRANNYLIHMVIAGVGFSALYVVVGFLLSKVSKGKKIETWF